MTEKTLIGAYADRIATFNARDADYADLEKRLRSIAETDQAKATLVVRFNEPTGEPDWTPFRKPSETLSSKLTEAADALASLTRELEEAKEALRPFAFESSPDVRFIFTHNPEALAGDHAHDNADFKGLCVLVIADPTWVSHMAVPEFYHAVKNARAALRLSREASGEDA